MDSIPSKEMWEEMISIIKNIDAKDYRTKISKEKTMKGKALFSPTDLNKRMKDDFEDLNWFESRTSYWVTDEYDLIIKTMHLKEAEQKIVIEEAGKVPIKSYNQTDF